MILEVLDQGRLERLAVINGFAGKDINGRAYIGGLPSHSEGGLMDEKQETEERIDCVMPYLQDLVQHENKREVEWVESPLHIRFGEEEES